MCINAHTLSKTELCLLQKKLSGGLLSGGERGGSCWSCKHAVIKQSCAWQHARERDLLKDQFCVWSSLSLPLFFLSLYFFSSLSLSLALPLFLTVKCMT